MIMLDLKYLTEQVCVIARNAGAYLLSERKNFSEDKIEQKHAHDYVSYVDKSSEDLIVKALRELLPEAGFLTEEGSATHENEPFWWVIDPLDGTTNYVHGFNPFAVCIALRNEKEILLGVVYEATLDECFNAYKGGGAFLNGNPIHVNDKHGIDQALLGIELPYDSTHYKDVALKLISHFYGYCGGIRMNGSAAVAICNIAAGRWDGWLERYIGQWDFMAAAIILHEAGGKVTNFEGDDFFLNGNNIVASNTTIHEELLKAILL